MGAKDNESRLEEESRSNGLGGKEDRQWLKRKENQNRRQRACRERKRRARQLWKEAQQQQKQQKQQETPVQVATTQAEEERRRISTSSSSVAVVVKVEKSPGELHIKSLEPQLLQLVDPIAQNSFAERKEDQNRRQRECRERKRRSQELENREKQKRAQQELLSGLGKEIREPHLGGGTTELMGHHHHQQSKAVQVIEDESTSMERSAAERAKELAPILYELTAGNGVEYQKLTLAKLLQQPLLQPVLPTFVSASTKGCEVLTRLLLTSDPTNLQNAGHPDVVVSYDESR